MNALYVVLSANPISSVGGGETRVAVRRRPVYADRGPPAPETDPSLRLVARRPNALNDGSADRGNFVAVRRKPTSPQVRNVSNISIKLSYR